MTTIAAVIADGKVHMAADSLAVWDSHRAGQVRKIVRKPLGESEALIARVGRHSLGLLAQHRMKWDAAPDPADDEDCDAWAFAVSEALCELAVDAKPSVTTQDGSMDGHAILAYAGRLWTVGNVAATRHERYVTAGSGEDYASGALRVLDEMGLLSREPAQSVARAVATAIEFNIYCGGPIQVEVLG